ncbi:hypothetical protein [Thiomicrospira microaerophila]|uniref:hypothetical protein n=1 Tax=Thiomicrospira microaerophila TaxID=406020 RepID=UPI0005C80729|nr:hypothetical protein [Thiomicrospira microaerophila]
MLEIKQGKYEIENLNRDNWSHKGKKYNKLIEYFKKLEDKYTQKLYTEAKQIAHEIKYYPVDLLSPRAKSVKNNILNNELTNIEKEVIRLYDFKIQIEELKAEKIIFSHLNFNFIEGIGLLSFKHPQFPLISRSPEYKRLWKLYKNCGIEKLIQTIKVDNKNILNKNLNSLQQVSKFNDTSNTSFDKEALSIANEISNNNFSELSDKAKKIMDNVNKNQIGKIENEVVLILSQKKIK